MESVRRVIARMVSTLGQRAVVGRTSRIEALHYLLGCPPGTPAVVHLWRLSAAHEELVYREPSVPRVGHTKPERLEDGSVERPTRLDVADTDGNVVEEPPGVLLRHRAEST
jgi:hypothetical protein